MSCVSADGSTKNGGGNDLTYVFENEKYTEDGSSTFLEFDVSVQANNNLTYLDNSVIVMSYNPASFGTGNNVLNGDIEVNRGSLISSISAYADPFVEDLPDADGKKYFKIIINTNLSNNFPVRAQVGTTLSPLCRVKMKIPDCSSATTSDILFEDHPDFPITGNNRAFYTLISNVEANTNFQLYDNLDYSDASMQFPMCQPLITNYTSSVPAGNDSHLIIEGRFLGDAPGEVKIAFEWEFPPLPLPDLPVITNLFIDLDEYDLNSSIWTDNYVDIVLPSEVCDFFFIDDPNNPFNLFGYGMRRTHSGRFQISNSLGMSSIYNDDYFLNIPFSIHMELDCDSETGQVYSKKRTKLVTNNSDGYMDIYVDREVYWDCEVMSAINKAIKIWRCATGIDWRIAGIVEDLNATQGDGICSIIFNPEPGTQPWAVTPSYGEDCGIYFEENEFDMEINPDLSSSFTEAKVLDIILHEFGHAHGLHHTLMGLGETRLDLMHQLGGSAPIITEVIEDDLAGALDIFDFSTDATCGDLFQPNQTGDYFMQDDMDDIGHEPNYNNLTAGSPACNYKNIYLSPDLWNCDHVSADCGTVHEMPTEGENNTIKARIRNLSDDCIAEEGYLDFYWTIGSTGEIWDSDWINSNVGGCLVGDIITSTPIPIGSLNPNQEIIIEHDWTPPIIDNLVACGIEMNQTYNQFMVCLLARIHSDKDPIFTEKIGTDIGYGIYNNNNIVTRNTFILEVPGFGQDPPCATGVSILVVNNNEFNANVNINVEGMSQSNLNENVGIELIPNQELWDRWSSTGQASEGLEVVDDGVLRVIDPQTARLLNVPLEAYQREVLSVQACDKTGRSANGRIDDVQFMISHESADPNIEIAPSSACIFKVQRQTSTPDVVLEEKVSIQPNPVSDLITVNIDLPEESVISISVSDARGVVLNKFLDNQKTGKGRHSFTYNLSHFPNGVYFLTYTLDEVSATKKIIKVN